MSPLVYPLIKNSISSGDSSSPPRFRWIKSTVRIMSNLAYHPKGLKVKEGPFRPGTNHPSSDVTTSDFRQLPLEFTIVHPGRVRGGARIVQYKMILKQDLIPIQDDPENV